MLRALISWGQTHYIAAPDTLPRHVVFSHSQTLHHLDPAPLLCLTPQFMSVQLPKANLRRQTGGDARTPPRAGVTRARNWDSRI